MPQNLSKKIKSKLALLPDKPGIYKMFNKAGKIIYIGKAKVLKNRVRSYFHSTHKDRKTKRLVKNIADIDYIITNTEDEALELEANAIRTHKPRYNILLKDDKSLPHIKITIKDDFPKISYTRTVLEDGAKYFGPYTKSKPVWKTLKLIEWLMPMRTCKKKIIANEQNDKPCLNYQMGKCPAPCAGKISYTDYQNLVKNVIRFLQGKNQDIVDDLKLKMAEFSENMDYEKAAKIRDQIINVENLHNQSNLYFFDKKDRDVLGIYKEENKAAVSVLKILSGRLLNKEIYALENVEDSNESEMLKAFLMQYYKTKTKDKLPYQILLQIEPDDLSIMQNIFKNRIKIPQKGEYKKLTQIAKKNAFFFVEEQKLKHLQKSNRTIFPVQELKDKLGLRKLPRKIYCFDISTIQGTDTVSSMVYFENGKPLKKNYRHFKMKTVVGQDDFASMKETLERVLTKLEKYEKPDLFVIDGGKGQLSSAYQILQNHNVTDIEMISLAKRVEEVFLPNNSESIVLPRNSPALRLLVHLRDESHRFAITFHRKLRSKRTLQSQLDNIPNIGEETKFLLLKTFGSIKNIRQSQVSELMQVKGIGEIRAKEIINYLQKNDFTIDKKKP